MDTRDLHHPGERHIFLHVALNRNTIHSCERILRVHVFRNQIQMVLQDVIPSSSITRMLHAPVSDEYPLTRKLPPTSRLLNTAWPSSRQNRNRCSELQVQPKSCTFPGPWQSRNVPHNSLYDARNWCATLVADNSSQLSKLHHLSCVSAVSKHMDTPSELLVESVLSTCLTPFGTTHTSHFPVSS